jgi:hypothetical protein
VIDVLFRGALVVLAELYGHMADPEHFNALYRNRSERMDEQLAELSAAGIRSPMEVVVLVFHSGSVIEVACDDIQVLKL